jgi:aminoglycoside 2'-N-acetyltransferase I
MTHPDVRGRGMGRVVMTRAAEFMRGDLEVDFGLLACPDDVLQFYERLGWREFTGSLWVEQPKGRTLFTMNRVMTLPVLADAPRSGTLDLVGLPW